MSRLVRELDKLQEKNKTKVTADDIVKEAETLLLNSYNGDNEVLRQLGLDHQIEYSNKLQQDVKRSELAQQRYNKSVYSGSEIKKLCNEYDLRLLPARDYNGSIPVDLARKVKEFCDDQDIIVRQNSFFVLAPVEQFKTIKHVPINADPILFYSDGSAESRTSYRSEASTSDTFVNVHYWGNDFTSIRKFRWLFNTYRYSSDQFSNLFRTAICAVIFSLCLWISLSSAYMFLGATLLGLVVIASILCYSYGVKTETLDNLWNTKDV